MVVAGTLLPGPKAERVDDGCVVVDGTSIAYAGPVADVPPAIAAAVDDTTDVGSDATLLPGLIDSHVHLGFDGGPDPVTRMKAETDAEQVVLMLRSARQLLSVGVTTARDLGARGFLDVVVRDAIAAGTARGPRLITAGPPLTVTGGHCWFMGGECDDVAGVRHRVRLHHKHGVDLIKVMATGGFMTAGSAPWYAQFDDEQLAAAVEESHRVGKRVAAHAHGVEGIASAVAAGVDTLEHCSFVDDTGFATADGELLDRIVAAGCYVCPTINYRYPDLIASRPADWRPAVQLLHERGARLIAGTDAGIDNVPHQAYVGGLEALVRLGIPPDEVLFAATVRAAAALDVSRLTGRLATGLDGDVIAVGGDPLADIAALHDLRLVMTRGEPCTPEPFPLPEIDPEELQRRLDKFNNAFADAPGNRAAGDEPAR